jgi:hypothetical protein
MEDLGHWEHGLDDARFQTSNGPAFELYDDFPRVQIRGLITRPELLRSFCV